MSGTVRLRRAAPADASAISELTRAAYAKWAAVIGREPRPMGVDYSAALEIHRFDLLHLGEVLVGLIETVDEGDGLLVENVAVRPDFQGQGLGSKLMAHAEALALSLGHRRIRLYTNKRFEENIRLYLSLGYGVDGEEDLGAGAIRVDMSKRLPEGRRTIDAARA